MPITVAGNYGTAQLINDPCFPGSQALLVNGTPARDTILVSRFDGAGKLAVTINGQPAGIFGPLAGRILVHGFASNDRIQIGPGIHNNVVLDGGAGDDTLTGSLGNDVLVGGDGSDSLIGSAGRDLLIGGTGADRLYGTSQSILIAGKTIYDSNDAALCAIMAEWTSAHSYALRVATLQPMLNALSVFLDTTDNLLAGSIGSDWFFSKRQQNGYWK